MTRNTLVLSSSDLPVETNEKFATQDPPPTEMKLTVDTSFLNLSAHMFNNAVHIYLDKYILDCVWRDSLFPDQTMTSNAGMSISRRLKVYLYAGDPDVSAIRLVDTPLYRESGPDAPDFYLYRDQTHIYEKAHNLYHPRPDLSSDLYFENQYTQQAETLSSTYDPGMYLGTMDPKALQALHTTRQITVRWKTDRTEYPSPFWYNRFLVGSSVWNPDTNKFEVQAPGTIYYDYHKKLGNIALGQSGPCCGCGSIPSQRSCRSQCPIREAGLRACPRRNLAALLIVHNRIGNEMV